MVMVMDLSRRSLLTRAGQGLVGLCAGWGAILAGRFCWPPRVEDPGQKFLAGLLSSLPMGSSKYFSELDVYLFHEPEGLFALSGKCTHLGCSVERQAEGFSCPCHGARFDRSGRVLSGPAPHPLIWYRLEVDRAARIWLYLDQQVNPQTWVRT
jgi:Rieske Fe-S protein